MFILPVLYAAEFMGSSTLCDAKIRIYTFLGIVMCATAVCWVLRDQRTHFLIEVPWLVLQIGCAYHHLCMCRWLYCVLKMPNKKSPS